MLNCKSPRLVTGQNKLQMENNIPDGASVSPSTPRVKFKIKALTALVNT